MKGYLKLSDVVRGYQRLRLSGASVAASVGAGFSLRTLKGAATFEGVDRGTKTKVGASFSLRESGDATRTLKGAATFGRVDEATLGRTLKGAATMNGNALLTSLLPNSTNIIRASQQIYLLDAARRINLLASREYRLIFAFGNRLLTIRLGRWFMGKEDWFGSWV